MGLRILHTADWHLGAAFLGFTQEQRQLLQQAQDRLPQMIVDTALRERCDLILIAGDIFDSNQAADAPERLARTLENCPLPVVICAGNHDPMTPDSPYITMEWPKNVHIFERTLGFFDFPELELRVYGQSYSAMDAPAMLENFRAAGDSRYCIGLFHGDPLHSSAPYCPITAAQVRESGLDYLALGHIHVDGSFRGGDTLCGWPGCPMGRGWDETGEKGAYLVTLGEQTEIHPVLLNTPRFYDRQCTTREIPELLREISAERENVFLRLTLTGTEERKIWEPRLSAAANLTLVDRTRDPESLWSRCGEDSLMGAYFRILREEQDAAAALLAAELSDRLLRGEEVSFR